MLPEQRGRSSRVIALAIAAFCCTVAVPTLASAALLGLPVPNPTVLPARDTEPVVLTGRDFGEWSAPANQTVRLPFMDLIACPKPDPLGDEDSDPLDLDLHDHSDCPHNHYARPDLDTAGQGPAISGTPINRLLGYRWDDDRERFVQIPFQVDEVFTRYLNNSASKFSAYSGEDQHTTYAFDREGFRFTANDPGDPCTAVPAEDPASDSPEPGGAATTADPVAGLDGNDEVVFMAGDAGDEAPAGAPLPRGIAEARAVTVLDPLTQKQRFAYVMRRADGGPSPKFNATNGYVRYERDPGADTFHFSESNNEDYGQAPKGPYCDANGNPDTSHGATAQRRPGDEATVTTRRYRFHYDGRWLMTDIRIAPGDDGAKVSPDDDVAYGPDLVDRWKARAFAQDPGSETPCCGFEDEDVNWGGSSQLLGERSGPVRAIRETWGADSGTNVVRRETFYRGEVRQKTWLRVHVIPPLDGIYAQWDFNAGRVSRYYNDRLPNGVPIDGRNDEAVGNLDDPCNPKYDAANNPNNTSPTDQQIRSAYKALQLCNLPYHQSVDVTDPTFGDLNAALGWNETTGPNGTIVDRYQVDEVTDLTPGGAAQSLFAVPYYRDDSCFDDGTGSDPGPRLDPGEANETATAVDGSQRKCWNPSTDPAVPAGSDRFYQGDIGTHGLHLLFQVDSDNGRMTVPLDEIVAEQRMVMLPPAPGEQEDDGSAGERYGRGFEKPLLAFASDTPLSPARATRPPNQAPQAAFDAPSGLVFEGERASFDASASTDPDGTLERYEWDLDGNGSFESDSGASPRASAVYTRAGAYRVSLRVTDDDEATATTARDIRVAMVVTARPAPPPSPRLTIGSRAMAARGAKELAVPLACPEPAAGRCQGTLALTLQGPRSLRLGSHRFSIASGAAKQVRVPLAPRARAALRQRKRARVRATALMSYGSGAVARVSRLLRVATRR
jgi:hypothetical protein